MLHIYDIAKEKLSDPNARLVVMVAMAGCTHKVYTPEHLASGFIKPEGNGLRIGKMYVFASQVRFAKINLHRA